MQCSKYFFLLFLIHIAPLIGEPTIIAPPRPKNEASTHERNQAMQQQKNLFLLLIHNTQSVTLEDLKKEGRRESELQQALSTVNPEEENLLNKIHASEERTRDMRYMTQYYIKPLFQAAYAQNLIPAKEYYQSMQEASGLFAQEIQEENAQQTALLKQLKDLPSYRKDAATITTLRDHLYRIDKAKNKGRAELRSLKEYENLIFALSIPFKFIGSYFVGPYVRRFFGYLWHTVVG